MPDATPTRILRRPEVEKLIGLRRSWLYAEMSAGRFPRPVRIGARAIGWRECDILKWLAEREVA